MKNAKLGTKILAGFGIVIFFMLAIGIVVSTTTLRTVNDMKTIDVEAGLLMRANSIMDMLNESRGLAGDIYIDVDTAKANEYTASAAKLENAFDDLLKYIAENKEIEGYNTDVTAAKKDFENWDKKVQQAVATNLDLLDIENQLVESGAVLSGYAAAMIQGQIDRISDSADIGRQEERIAQSNAINDSLVGIRLLAREMIGSLNISQVHELYDKCDTARQQLLDFEEMQTSQRDREEMRKIYDQVGEYSAIIKGFESTRNDVENVRTDAIALETAVTTRIGAGIGAINSDVTQIVSKTKGDSSRVLGIVILLFVIATGFAVPIALYIRNSITKPISMQMGFLKQVGETGSLQFTDAEWKHAREAMTVKDETGEMLTAFVKMLEQFIGYGKALESIADKDLSIEVKKLSGKDTMGNALEKMLDNLNEMFGEIVHVAAQVANSSGEIAHGSQTLAQGSTEQAATVEELSNSITNVSMQAEQNTTLANDTVAEVNEAGRLMTESLAYMQDMISAMGTIDESSTEIAKVISVIDNIAFQTNILALNAAVEAARAGQHGKGFAVVANEVRSLASKSAAAAQETAALIENSVTNVKHGSIIAEKTSESLKKVGEIAGNNAVSMGKLSVSSVQQSEALAEINTGVEQISQVVQQNSATSEESAAASQMMNSQAQTLQGFISKFKLRDGVGTSGGSGNTAYMPLPEMAAGDEMLSFGKY